MKIRKISFINHPILSNLELDFVDKAGKAVNTIILAGENGVGKSLILRSLFSIFNFNISNLAIDFFSTVEIELLDKDCALLSKNVEVAKRIKMPIDNNIIYITTNPSKRDCTTRREIKYMNDGKQISTTCDFFVTSEAKKIFKTIFSDTEINYTPSSVNSVTSMDTDLDEAKCVRSTSSLATEIKQLLIDIKNADAISFSEWAENNKGCSIDPDHINIRMDRFTSAFNFMFPSKKFKGIVNYKNTKDVIFVENDKEMSIAYLSSGEKQVVFRGCFLLKDKMSILGSVILIDEPEISMHPLWQIKILSFFKMLFTVDGTQTSQIITATHSPFIIHNVDRCNDKVIVLKKNSSGEIYVLDHPTYYNWSPEEEIKEAFCINIDFDEKITYILLEGITDENYFKKAAEIFNLNNNNKLDFKYIGSINERGEAIDGGYSALDKALIFLNNNPYIIKGNIVLLYDSDVNNVENKQTKIDKIIIRKMSINYKNNIKKGVENLLVIPNDINIEDFKNEKNKDNGDGFYNTIRELNKNKLCDYICNKIEVNKQKEILINFKNEIEKYL